MFKYFFESYVETPKTADGNRSQIFWVTDMQWSHLLAQKQYNP